jgi:hypothetical protein
MIKNFANLQRLGQNQVDIAIKCFGVWNRGLRTITADMSDYTKRTLEDSAATFEKLLSAKSIEHVCEIQNDYTRRAGDGYLHQLSKIGGMYAELLKETYNPFDGLSG